MKRKKKTGPNPASPFLGPEQETAYVARNPATEAEQLITWNGLEGEDFELGFERYTHVPVSPPWVCNVHGLMRDATTCAACSFLCTELLLRPRTMVQQGRVHGLHLQEIAEAGTCGSACLGVFHHGVGQRCLRASPAACRRSGHDARFAESLCPRRPRGASETRAGLRLPGQAGAD